MKNLSYTVPTAKSVDEAVSAVEKNAVEYGFSVLHIHDIAAALAKRGFKREPLKIVEICNAKYAHEALNIEVTAALMLPCPIAVYQEKGRTYISTVKPSAIAGSFSGRSLEFISEQIEVAVLAIVDDSAGNAFPAVA